MQDRFRFRVWDKEEKEYYYDAEKTYDYLNGIMSESFGELLEDDRYIVEQCTGIRDKNGVLIFEGDLIRLVVDGEIKNKGVVKWCDSNGTFNGSWLAIDPNPNSCGYYGWQFSSPYWEVYYNIHNMEIEKND